MHHFVRYGYFISIVSVILGLIVLANATAQ